MPAPRGGTCGRCVLSSRCLPWAPCPPPRLEHCSLPFQVFQQEEEGDEVGVGQGAEQVHHAVFLGSRV